ncbi:MAG: ATP-binding cassette domain-containing protein [Bacteroides sp.]|nr:ATP-binding cassette domain-containing protein [Bacteroides sp.]
MSVVEINNLSVTYSGKNGTTEALHNVSLQMNEGDIYSVIGPSGSGKSTLLYVLAGIINYYTGKVLINGEKPQPIRQSIGLVPQHYGLLPWKRVKDNIFLPEKLRKDHQNERNTWEIISALSLDNLLQRYPHELSGGQQQRVALARSFIQKPDLLLMDEPFSALDALTADRSRKLFLDVWQKNPVSTLFITHNIEEAVHIGKQVVLLSSSPGQILYALEKPTLEEIRQLISDKWI